jgi:hypothetical protein
MNVLKINYMDEPILEEEILDKRILEMVETYSKEQRKTLRGLCDYTQSRFGAIIYCDRVLEMDCRILSVDTKAMLKILTTHMDPFNPTPKNGIYTSQTQYGILHLFESNYNLKLMLISSSSLANPKSHGYILRTIRTFTCLIDNIRQQISFDFEFPLINSGGSNNSNSSPYYLSLPFPNNS